MARGVADRRSRAHSALTGGGGRPTVTGAVAEEHVPVA
jgi:hypothetical protein